MCRENGTVDLFKFIAIVLVIGIHLDPFGANPILDQAFGVITRLAVPYFFVASGYYFFKKGFFDTKYFLHLLKLYIIWSLVYLPFRFEEVKEKFAQSFFQGVRVVLNDAVYSHLWFLIALFFSLLILCVLRKYLSDEIIVIISVVIFIFGVLNSTYIGALEAGLGSGYRTGMEHTVMIWGARNALFYGIPYTAMGLVFLKKKKTSRITIHIVRILIGMLGIVIEGMIGVRILRVEETILWFSVYVVTYFIFSFSMEYPCQLKAGWWMRKMSFLIYVGHILLVEALYQIWRPSTLFAGISRYILITGVCIVISYLVIWGSKRKYGIWLKIFI